VAELHLVRHFPIVVIMNAKIISQIIAGVFALATTWLSVVYTKERSASDAKSQSIVQLEDRVRKLESAKPSDDGRIIKQRIRDILAPKGGVLARLRETVSRLDAAGAATPDQRQAIRDAAAELDEVDRRLEGIAEAH
jgi:hypothetical protein